MPSPIKLKEDVTPDEAWSDQKVTDNFLACFTVVDLKDPTERLRHGNSHRSYETDTYKTTKFSLISTTAKGAGGTGKTSCASSICFALVKGRKPPLAPQPPPAPPALLATNDDAAESVDGSAKKKRRKEEQPRLKYWDDVDGAIYPGVNVLAFNIDSQQGLEERVLGRLVRDFFDDDWEAFYLINGFTNSDTILKSLQRFDLPSGVTPPKLIAVDTVRLASKGYTDTSSG